MERENLIGLVTRAQQGNSTAMDELFSAFYNDVYYFALKTVKDSDTACDITQEAFLEIINTIGSLKEPAAFVTWMKQITYHQCTRYFKKKKEVLVEEDEDGNTIFDTLADESEGSIPSEVYEKEEFRNTILGIINELTEEQRSAVMMYYFDELTVAQIAEIQGVSEGTVKSRLNYARKALKKSVESYEKKHNIRLHSFSFLPLFALFFGKELMPVAKAAEIQTAVAEAAGTAGTGAAGTAGAAAAAAGSAGATIGAVLGAKIAAIPIVTKVIACVAAVAVAAGGSVALLHNPEQTEYDAGRAGVNEPTYAVEEVLHLDSEEDGCCDHCGERMCVLELVDHRIPEGSCLCEFCGTGSHTEGDSHPFCGICNERLPLDDQDGDGVCNVCGEYSCGGSFHGSSHTDQDGDGLCDICKKHMCGLIWGLKHNVNYNDGIYDGKCDDCGQNTFGAMGWPDEEGETHADANTDGICDQCGKEMCHIYGTAEFGGVDADGDEKCDICKLFLCDGHDGFVYHYDFNSDGKCDRCDHSICAHGYLPHTDEDNDQTCDICYGYT